jgi:hypothetical protein
MPSAPTLDFRHSPGSFRQLSHAGFAFMRGIVGALGLSRPSLSARCRDRGAGVTKCGGNTPGNVSCSEARPLRQHAAFAFFAFFAVPLFLASAHGNADEPHAPVSRPWGRCTAALR